MIDKKAYFIDAPVSGGQVGAENGVLSIMCGGERTTFNKAKKNRESEFAAYIPRATRELDDINEQIIS